MNSVHDMPPCIEEQYISATTSSNLRVQAEKRSDADILIASGISGGSLGGALMRLHSEYSRGGVPMRSATQTDHILLMAQLKTLGVVLEAITAQAMHWRIERPEQTALAIVAHFLDDTCRKCDGRGNEQIKDTPALSNKPCKHCHGTGKTALPYGGDGRRLELYMKDCVNRWRQRTAKSLHNR